MEICANVTWGFSRSGVGSALPTEEWGVEGRADPAFAVKGRGCVGGETDGTGLAFRG